jgi:hypothetical protein
MDTTEKQVQQYFASRPGWTAHKIPRGNTPGQVPDFRICHGGRCFLCEVKTIRSVRADIPEGKVVDHFTDQREKKRAMVDQLSRENPATTLLITGGEWEWLNASDSEFRRRYAGKQRGTEGKFMDHFGKPLRQRLESCGVAHLPYDVRLDSNHLYLASKEERERFVDWLEDQVAAIDRGDRADWRWVREDRPYPTPVYSAHYPLHEPVDHYDSEHHVSVCLHKRGWTDDGEGLRVDIHCYGTLNVERVRSSVEKAIGQLRGFARREQAAKRLARVIVLKFRTGLDFDQWNLLDQGMTGLLKENQELSAIAVLDYRPDGDAPPTEEGISAWLRFLEQTPRVPYFVVYHNGWLSATIDPLDPHAFRDRWSTQKWVGPRRPSDGA